MKIKDLHFRICDNGLFLPLASRLARDAGKVSYWSPCMRAFPVVRDLIGSGIEKVERVDHYYDDIDSVDCFVFPDIGMASLQKCLRECYGVPCWGSGDGDEIEIDRGIFLDVIKETKLPVPVYEEVEGVTRLLEMLQDKEDVWIKISRFRGDFETYHWRSADEDENILCRKLAKLGPFRESMRFYVFDPIDAEIEDGCDSWCIDGKFPSIIIHGMEAKDKAYVGTFQKFEDLPEEVRAANDEFAPVLGDYGYRGFFSTEIRITPEGEGYFIDPTCRAGSPPSQCMAEMVGNLAEVIWAGANGELAEPEPAAKFGVQAICNFKRVSEGWSYVKLDYELQRWVKSSNCMMLKDVLCMPPREHEDEVNDWLVGIGDTFEEAIRHLKHNVDLLPSCATCEFASLSDLLREVQEAEKNGMKFTDQPVPDPSIIVDELTT